MNAQRLQEVAQFLLLKEADHKIQDRLTKLRDAVTELAAAPAESPKQTAVAQALAELEAGVETLTASMTPAQMKDIVDVRGYDYFSSDIVRRIRDAYRQNGVTPAVLQKEVAQFVADRRQYLDNLLAAVGSLTALGVKLETLSPGQAELEVLLPRDLFENDLGNFQEELRILYRMIRTFSEVANVTPGIVEIKQISSSDPTLFLGLDVTTLVLIGVAIKWGIDLIKSTIEIKKLISGARAAGIDQDVVAALDGQIRKRIDNAIEQKVDALLAEFKGDAGRRNELKGPLENALGQLLQRIERGMILEIRLLPPPPPVADAGEEAQSKYQEFERLALIANSLEFPKIEGEPALQLIRRDGPEQQPGLGANAPPGA